MYRYGTYQYFYLYHLRTTIEQLEAPIPPCVRYVNLENEGSIVF